MDGFKLYISNTSKIPPSDYLCYKDSAEGFPKVTETIPCNQIGQYIIYYDDKVGYGDFGNVIELCYVAIYDNIATDAIVSQNPVGSQPAYLANDGDKTSCSKTQGTNVRFHVDMKEIRIVTEIYITGKVNSTMKGVHTIYASNSSAFPEKVIVLYQGEAFPTAIGVHAVFRYLTYVPGLNNTFSEIEICEIGIVACRSGYYGRGCIEQCSVTCINPRCSHITGECIGGCKSGWKGINCTQECSIGYFGGNCTEFCGGCLSNSCDPVDGLCNITKACKPGYIGGDYCNQKCSDGYFGVNCTSYCWGCLSNMCDPLDECNKGHFGDNCTDYCWGCISNWCDPLDGLCHITAACSPGYLEGEYCNKTCDNGFYGSGCLAKCSFNCNISPCNHISGECIGGCKNGWMGFNCTDGCDDWSFGNNCSSRCNCLKNPCEKCTGTCPIGGCKTEWLGESCNQVRSTKLINWLAIGGGVAGLVIIILILSAVCFIYKRKEISIEGKYSDNLNGRYRNIAINAVYDHAIPDQAEVTYSRVDREETELPSTRDHFIHSYKNLPIVETFFNNKIPIETLKQVFNEKRKDCGFKKEFEDLPKEHVYPCVEGSREENKVKNRFLTTLPCMLDNL
ncbi:Hypothetical predicted protein [Mytilus galloprovincialis]|uniref:Uncharacterized protein n=1 Tax=Mytilus galloprovincialis TaxID=29158 RepID=A0A8B6HPY1_MYTGA|nr:Hypothetical predicted protein [Mytilus galloprovincialis]